MSRLALSLFLVGCTYDFTLGEKKLADAGTSSPPSSSDGGVSSGADSGPIGTGGEQTKTCGFECECTNNASCVLNCGGANACAPTCRSGSACTINCGAGFCSVGCASNTTCVVNCSAGACNVDCQGKCTINCSGGLCQCDGPGCPP